jgi:kynurenine formamidase
VVPEPPTQVAADTAERLDFAGRRWTVIDLSQNLSNATSSFEPMPHAIEYSDHTDTAPIAEQRFGLGAEYWPDGLVWAHERLTLTTHSGTHIDAPYHYAPTSGGLPARTVDQLPLRWLMGDGVVLTVTRCDRRQGITLHDVRAELDRIGYELKPYDIVLLRTDVSQQYGEPGYDLRHPGLRREATKWLVEHGVRLIGIDAWGLDRAFDIMADEARAGNKDQLWESHKFGVDMEYCQIEKLTNLAAIPQPFGFQVLALPVKIERASAGWSRVIALVEEPKT